MSWAKPKVKFAKLPCVRYLILLLCILAFTLLHANQLALHFTVICMDHSQYSVHQSPNSRNGLFMAGTVGSLLGGFPTVFLIARLGLRRTFALYGLISALATLLLPFASLAGYIPLLFAKAFQGTSLPVQFIMVGSVSHEWSPLQTIGTYMILLSCHFQLGAMFVMPFAAFVCQSAWGWSAVYYIQGALTLIFFAFFYCFFRDTPQEHFLVGKEELSLIKEGRIERRTSEDETEELKPPYLRMLLDPVVISVLLAFWGDEIGDEIFAKFGPVFLNKVLGHSVQMAGIYAAMPFFCALVVKLLIGPINDNLPWKNQRIRIGIFGAISQYGLAISFAALAFLPKAGAPMWLIQGFYSAVNVFVGFQFLGTGRAAQQIAQQFTHVLMAWESIISSAAALFITVYVHFLAPHDSLDEWQKMLLSIAVMEVLVVTLFLAVCNCKPRPWTRPNREQKSSKSETA